MDVKKYFDKGWAQPVPGYAPWRETYNEKRGTSSKHRGIDIKAPAETEIHAVDGGTVYKLAYNVSAGNYVQLKHANGDITTYCHMIRKTGFLKIGDTVVKGQLVGHVGSTGSSDTNHLHFGWKINNVWHNAYPYLMSAYDRYPDYFYKTAPYRRIGDHVTLMQERLTLHGFPCEVDGAWGTETQNAVLAFQRAKGLKADGKVYEATWKALEAEPMPPPEPGTWTLARVLSKKLILMKGDDVKDVQRALISAGYECGASGADGKYGNDTLAAVKAFQTMNKLTVDGKVGKNTCAALGGVWVGR